MAMTKMAENRKIDFFDPILSLLILFFYGLSLINMGAAVKSNVLSLLLIILVDAP